MPKVTAKPNQVLNAYGPNDVVIATSDDGGKTWTPTKDGLAIDRALNEPRVFTRRLAAVIEAPTPSAERRIAIPFSVLHEVDILAGWAPAATIMALGPDSLDALVLTDLATTSEQVVAFRSVAPVLMLDVDATVSLEGEAWQQLDHLLPLVDAVTVPTDLLASRLRPYHARVFVVPDLLRAPLWQESHRAVANRPGYVTVAVPTDASEAMRQAITAVADKYRDRVRFQTFDPVMSPASEPDFYHSADIVLLPPPRERHQVSQARVLPPMAAQCCLVADRLWPLVISQKNGFQVGRDTVQHWASTLSMAINDSRGRIRMGREARSQARRWTPQTRLHQVALPYRLTIPKGQGVSYG